jgi:hypothetical protein
VGQLTLYFDRCFGKRLPNIVQSARPPFDVKSHFGEGFGDKTPDDEWLATVGKKGWIVLSYDSKFHLDSPALAAIEQFGIGCFYLWGAQLPTWDQLCVLTRAYPKIVEHINVKRKPYIFRVGTEGKMSAVKAWDRRRSLKRTVVAAE